MSSNKESSEKIMKPVSKQKAKNQGTIMIGVFGLICSIIDLGGFTILGLLIVVAADSFTWGVEVPIFYTGIFLGVIGVILGIIGATKDKKKFTNIVAIIAGIISIAMTLLI